MFEIKNGLPLSTDNPLSNQMRKVCTANITLLSKPTKKVLDDV